MPNKTAAQIKALRKKPFSDIEWAQAMRRVAKKRPKLLAQSVQEAVRNVRREAWNYRLQRRGGRVKLGPRRQYQ